MYIKSLITNLKLSNRNGVLILFTIILFFCFKFRVHYNEMDVVPFARAVYDKDWLRQDWYLNLVIPYRYFFSYLIGFFATNYGFIKTIVFGRIISYLLIAVSLNHLINSLRPKVNKLFFYFVILLFFKFTPLGIGAKEWMVGGLETKVFAYAMAVFSLSFFLRKKYISMFFYAGLSLSFHLLVGIYNLFCLTPIALFFLIKNELYLKKFLKAIPIFIVTGSIGLFGIVNYFFNRPDDVYKRGWDIYVNIRVPHHTLPSSISNGFWWLLFLFALINVFFVVKFKKREVKLISLYALSSVLISLIGLLLFFTCETQYLKYYFFRTSCIILPLITFLNMAFILGGEIKEFSLVKRIKIKYLYVVVVCVLLGLQMLEFISDFSLDIKKKTVNDIEMVNWVKRNTDENKMFITTPNDKYFYINYERGMFVSWKHSPQASLDLVEWYNRLKLLNSGNDFKKLKEVKEGYLNLTKESILKISKTYKNIGYLLMPNDIEIDLPILYQSNKNILYKI